MNDAVNDIPADWGSLGTCVTPGGRFAFGLHQPHFRTTNLRQNDYVLSLGKTDDGRDQLNLLNFPPDDVEVPSTQSVFEVANPFPFKGVTYIGKTWADEIAADPTRISIPSPKKVSMAQSAHKALGVSGQLFSDLVNHLPGPLKLALATTSTDALDLKILAENSCQFIYDETGSRPEGLAFGPDPLGRMKPKIFNKPLFDAVANNPCLDDAFKEAMLLRPGIQGNSEIVGEWIHPQSHVFEYLRGNSYIPWGHYAANMAHDAIRYAAGDLTRDDMMGMRHLYYQRIYVQLAGLLGISLPKNRRRLSEPSLEDIRRAVLDQTVQQSVLDFNATLWGWNYGYDYAPSGYRLHASHQQIHQQFALIPSTVALDGEPAMPNRQAFACGDLVADFCQRFKACTGVSFFECYQRAIQTNKRMDNRRDGPSSLIVHEDSHAMLFVPKAQTSQWELQLMPKNGVGNILEADTDLRRSLDRSLLIAMRLLAKLGASMITVFEYSKRFNARETDQRLLYTFLPRLPESPGAFSEAQLRWINGHYPEDFALACRLQIEYALKEGY